MTQVIRISDLPHPDHEGKSYREVNLEKQHNIPVGELVEIESSDWNEDYDGMRLYVVGHHRDCDGTPLYALGKKGEDMWDNGCYLPNAPKGHFHSPKTFHGFSEDCLTVIEK